MHKYMTAFCALVATSAFAAVAAPSADASRASVARPSAPLRILPLGDSITYGSHGQDTAGYRGPLYQMLTNAHYRIDYVGTDGGTQGYATIRPQ